MQEKFFSCVHVRFTYVSKFEGTCSHFGKICKPRQTWLKTYASFVDGKGVLAGTLYLVYSGISQNHVKNPKKHSMK